MHNGKAYLATTVAIGPDEMLYISVGSTCDECDESNPENASLLRGSLDGKQFDLGNRAADAIGWGWHPETGGMDHGSGGPRTEAKKHHMRG